MTLKYIFGTWIILVICNMP